MQIITSLLLSLIILPSFQALPNAHGNIAAFGTQEVNEQINKTITLSEGSNVRVSSISGGVNIETWDGDKAEINIKIRASSREAMERRPLIVENTPNSLTIHTQEDREGRRSGGDRGWVHQDVRLRLPKSINLRISSIGGSVDVGQITGEIALSSIGGGVEVTQAGTATQMSSIGGGATISLLRIEQGGLRVSSIGGGVEIGLPATINAELEVRSVGGGIDTDLPINVVGQMKHGQLRGTIGTGGPQIIITSVGGSVRLRRM
ncbi:MAG: hypothetical protein L0226_00300 [Acidobacteria bacterium]|nr:hypothetical protein [Acidobacteriota bacterium]